MTPRQFSFLAERYKRQLRHEDRRAGEIIAMLYNIHRDTAKDPAGIDWRDVFPEWKEVREQSEEEMFGVMQTFAALHPEGSSH